MTIGMPDYTSTPENFKVVQVLYCLVIIALVQICLKRVLTSLVCGFQCLANCRTEVCKALGMAEEQCELSMGMSGDFELAVSLMLLGLFSSTTD